LLVAVINGNLAELSKTRLVDGPIVVGGTICTFPNVVDIGVLVNTEGKIHWPVVLW